MAKRLLKAKKLDFVEININSSAAIREEMINKSGGKKTVPQIFINDTYVGGYDDLKEADSNGGLAKILNKT